MKFRLQVWVMWLSALVLFNAVPLHAQLNQSRVAQNRLQSGKWEKAYRLLRKSLRKDSADVESQVVLTQWFLAKGNPGYQVDSADYYLRKSTSAFNRLSPRERDRVQRFPVDSMVLASLRLQIDSLAFEEAKQVNTEEVYMLYLTRFPKAKQARQATELRDEVSYLDALKENTYTAFREYLQKYPGSLRADEAKTRYEKLLYEEKTRDKKLQSYRGFVAQHPASPYAAQVHQQIFEIMTAAGQPENFLQYLSAYPATRNAQQARDLLFHLYKEWEEKIPEIILTDSLRNVLVMDSQSWITIYKNGLFGFMDQSGVEVLSPRFDDVEEDYKCEAIRDDILDLKEGIFSRTGKKLAGAGTEVTSIGYGFLKVSHKNCTRLIHKSGLEIVSGCYDDFKIAGGSFVVAYRKNEADLFTLAGRQLPVPGLSDAREIEDVLVLTRLGKKNLVTPQQVAALADGMPLSDQFVFDDVVALAKGLLLVRNGALEGIINSNLEFTVALDRHTLVQTPFALLETRPTGTLVHGLPGELKGKEWHKVSYHQQWLLLSSEGQVQLYHMPSRKMASVKADSVWFEQRLAFVQTGSQVMVFLSATHAIELQPDSKIRFIASRDSVRFFYTESRNKKLTVFNLADGGQKFVTEFELVESIGDHFVVSKASRKGLVNSQGKVVVPVEMETIILNPEGQLSLLKNKKFGLYDFKLDKLIKPEFERNLVPLNATCLVAFRDGKYGIVGWDMKPLTPFEYDEIVPWQGDEIWVKQNRQWLLLDFKTKEIVHDKVRSFTWIKKNNTESILRIQRENFFGIISSTRGVIIPATFHQVINLGTGEVPFYFTEKQVEEAGIYVVIYYDAFGKLVRRQALEEEEYERLVCDAN
ncbi:MAG: WG repeat-containing protein [Cyclobacteriaceae bacterium]|nr:WG repeat-containing protein [Cyclobacteriaceae bacterium]